MIEIKLPSRQQNQNSKDLKLRFTNCCSQSKCSFIYVCKVTRDTGRIFVWEYNVKYLYVKYVRNNYIRQK